jgi:heme oxygenase
METTRYLKRSTQAAHSEVEALMGSQHIRISDLWREEYNRTIQANYQL